VNKIEYFSKVSGQDDYNDIQDHIRQQPFDIFTMPIGPIEGRHYNGNGEQTKQSETMQVLK